MGRVEAIVVNHLRRGPNQMTGMGAAFNRVRRESRLVPQNAGGPFIDAHVRRNSSMGDLGDVLNTLTGGEFDAVKDQLNTLEIALKVSIAASCVAGAFALMALLRGR